MNAKYDVPIIYQELLSGKQTMNNYPVKGFIEKTKGTFKRVTGKLSGGKTAATSNKVPAGDGNVQAGHDEVKDGVKKTI